MRPEPISAAPECVRARKADEFAQSAADGCCVISIDARPLRVCISEIYLYIMRLIRETARADRHDCEVSQ